jgi:metal-dependent hydrolase (beta-lactamase superfamily II)
MASETFSRRSKLMVRRLLSPGMERKYKNYINDLINRYCKATGRTTKPAATPAKGTSDNLKTGDWVRVRSLKEIAEIVNHWKQVKGCAFMPEMAKYCGTTQRVLKSMKRFVDERDLLIKKSNGIILLEGIMCEGTEDFGRCDRSCFRVWREEWLERIEKPIDPGSKVLDDKLKKTDQWITVRSLKEIKATLNYNKELNGCSFLPEMSEYCGTKQQVLKCMDRFVDEHDLRVKKSSGIVLLDGVTCQGKSDSITCDRSCFYLWRKEWLKMDTESIF